MRLRHLFSLRCILLTSVFASGTADISLAAEPEGGALAGERHRVIVSTDLGGSDEDDMQSLVHYLVYADVFDTEGIISSPPKAGRKEDVLKVIAIYEKDFPRLRRHSERYPEPNALRRVTMQGAVDPAPEAGFSRPTEGSKHIVACARRDDARPLYVLVWGSITDVAQAVHDAPDIKEKIRVYFIASWNAKMDPRAVAYLDRHHPDLWMIYCNVTFRGFYQGGNQSGEWGNRTFVETHVSGHGTLGDFFNGRSAAGVKSGAIKMGDTPSVTYLLRGNANDPGSPSWGGQFQKRAGHPNGWEDRKNARETVNRWRVDALADWSRRMDRLLSD